MKRCPECRRDYYDDTLIYCLDDGNTLLEGPGTMSEPATAILPGTGASSAAVSGSESPTRSQIGTTVQTAILPHSAEAEPQVSLGGRSEKHGGGQHFGRGSSVGYRGTTGRYPMNGCVLLTTGI